MIRIVVFFFANFFLLANSSPLIPYVGPQDYERSNKAPADYRLPNETIPISYEITLIVDPNESRFNGTAMIVLTPLKLINRIVLHNNRLNITSYSIVDSSGRLVPIVNVTEPSDDDYFYTINTELNMVAGRQYNLSIEYDAPFSSALDGLYKSSYMINGTRRYIATTQFQPTHARKVFPCYDEPALKATFTIHIYAPEGYSSICNMDTVPSTLEAIDGYNVTSFRSTPKMSSYLVAFVVSDFQYKSNIRDGEIIYPREYRVYARSTAQDTLDYSLDIGQRSFQYLHGYTDVNYRLPKIDNVALPDFGAGAMENWGLITYREEYMLNYKNITTTNSKMIISTIMAHENAHFWFGNEVSPLWWDYTWLNEGFATFFEFYATDQVYEGTWRLMEQFVVNEMQNSLVFDSTPTTNAMSATVGSPDEIRRNFNTIAYSKAGSVIRMFQHVFGTNLFRLSLSSYLKSLPTGVSEPKILFNEMQKVIGQTDILPKLITVEDVFGSWSEQPGYPVIKLSKSLAGEAVTVHQMRFYQNESLSSNQTWWIPLTWATKADPDFTNTTTQKWVQGGETIVTLKNAEWYIFNKQMCGYYRIMYDLDNYMKLVELLKNDHHPIHPLNRAQLIDDAAMFSRTGRLTYNVTFGLLNYLANEDDWIPWVSTNRALSFLNVRMPGSAMYRRYRAFIAISSKRAFDSVSGFDSRDEDDYVTRRLRTLITKIACDSGLYDCLEDAEMTLDKSLTPPETPLDPDLKSVVYCSGVRKGLQSLWLRAFDRYTNTSSESEKSFIINGLGCVENDDILDSYLNMVITNTSKLRTNDRVAAVRSAINSGPFGIGRVLLFLIKNFLALKASVSSTTSIIQNLGNVIAADIHIELFDNFTATYESNFDMSEKREVETAKINIGNIVSWRDSYMEEIDSWIDENVIIDSSGFIFKSSLILTICYSMFVLLFNS